MDRRDPITCPHHLLFPQSMPGGLAVAQGLPPAQGELSPSDPGRPRCATTVPAARTGTEPAASGREHLEQAGVWLCLQWQGQKFCKSHHVFTLLPHRA